MAVKSKKKMNRVRVVVYSTLFVALYITANYSKVFPPCIHCIRDLENGLTKNEMVSSVKV
jgi:hypothetical protein